MLALTLFWVLLLPALVVGFRGYEKPILGIDLGNSVTRVAYTRNGRTFDLLSRGFPSVVGFSEDGTVKVGEQSYSGA